jgi:hypothetical protein
VPVDQRASGIRLAQALDDRQLVAVEEAVRLQQISPGDITPPKGRSVPASGILNSMKLRNAPAGAAILLCAFGSAAQQNDPDFSEIERIYEADQKDRASWPNLTASPEELKKISQRDEFRRK